MTDAKHTPLLPCPFCGANDAKLFENSYSDMAWVSCIACGLEAPSETGVKADQAVDYWNTRSYASSQAEIARLRELLEGTADALKTYMSAVDQMNSAMQDGINVHGAVAGLSGSEDMANWAISEVTAALSVKP